MRSQCIMHCLVAVRLSDTRGKFKGELQVNVGVLRWGAG